MEKNNKILTVINVNKFFRKRNTLKHALKNINFEVEEGDFFGIIGESGSGKTTLGKSIVRLHNISGGSIYFYDKLISNKKIKKADRHYICSNVQMIFQDPMSSLNPKMNILRIISEPLIINREIHKKVNLTIKKKHHLNSIFGFDILNKIEQNSLPKILDFYKKYEKEIENHIDNLKAFNYSNADDWITSFNEIDEQYSQFINKMKVHINELSTIISDEEKIIHDSFAIKKDDIDVYNFVNNIVQYNDDYIQAKAKFNEANNLVNSFKNNLKEKKIKNILRIKCDEFIIQKKFHFDNSKVKTDKMAYFNELIQYHECKTQINFIKKILSYESLSDNEIKSDVEEIYLSIENYFKKINDKLFSIKTNEQFNSEILEIKNKISQEEINKIIDPLIIKFDEKWNKKNIDNKIKDEQELRKLEAELQNAKQEFKKHKGNNKKSNLSKKTFANTFNLFKKQYQFANQSKYSLIRDSIKQTKKNIKKKMKLLLNAFNDKTKTLYLIRPKELNEFTKKEQKSIISKNMKSFKIQIATKKKTFKSVDWEAWNIIDINFINRKLCSSCWIKLWFYKGELIKLIILDTVFKLLESVGLKREHAYRYPHEFSGGQRQRIVIARSLITNPKLIVADEPISALDVSVQAQVINIMKDLCEKKGMTFLFIAHDLSMVQHICNKVIIMHNGSIVEKGYVEEVFKNPIHPYTKSLFMAVPELNKMDINLAAFDDNSDYEKEYSISNEPRFFKVSEGHEVLASESQFRQWAK